MNPEHLIFMKKKVTTYMQSRSCNKMNIYCHSNHTLKQDSATTSSSETFNRTDYLHGHGRLENRTAQSLEFLPTRSCDLNEHMQPPLFAFYSYADNPTGVKQQQEDEKKNKHIQHLVRA